MFAFSQLNPTDIEAALDKKLSENRAALTQLLNTLPVYTWEDLIAPLEEMQDRLHEIWLPIEHLHTVLSTETWRELYRRCLPKMTIYGSELAQNEKLYQAYRSIAQGSQYATLDPTQKKILHDELRDFRLGGAELTPEGKAQLTTLETRLAELSTLFGENVQDATDHWQRHITDPVLLSCLPAHALETARQAAEAKQLTGWLLTLEYPCYHAVMQYADDRALREEMYTASCTRASDQGPHAGQWDNGPVMDQILAVRHEMATLLGFNTYAEYSLATKMAESPPAVLAFLYDLAKRARPRALEELIELQAFANTQGITSVEAWDHSYLSEKLRQKNYAISEKEVKPYFPVDHVLKGMFAIVERLFNIHVQEKPAGDAWHPEVRRFEISDPQGQRLGEFYTDLYARSQKRSGAWMESARGRRRTLSGEIQTPIAFLVCNFNGPTRDAPPLLTHEDVITLFHEFGHGLHHVLTRIDYAGASGMVGVPWDAVEFPSQFLENWCWEKEGLALISQHYETKASLPEKLLQRLQKAKHFHSGMHLLRQCEYSLFDFRIHHEYSSLHGGRVLELLSQVRKEVAVIFPPAFNRFPNNFSHIFAGGYSAGYYSYLWAEVLASDAFEKFEKEGVLDPQVGQLFLETILSAGGSRSPLELFIAFRGRKPQIDALLRRSGISSGI